MDLGKLSRRLTVLIRIFIIIIAIWTICIKEYNKLGILAITMIITFYDIFLEKILKIKIDNKLRIAIIIFIFAAQCLGSVLDFYDMFHWWDTMLHTISGVIFFYMGISLIKQINSKTNKAEINRIIVVLFGFCFSFAIAVFWELIEFAADSLFNNANMQIAKGLIGQDALKDTMIDLISVTVGTTFITILEGLRK